MKQCTLRCSCVIKNKPVQHVLGFPHNLSEVPKLNQLLLVRLSLSHITQNMNAVFTAAEIRHGQTPSLTEAHIILNISGNTHNMYHIKTH